MSIRKMALNEFLCYHNERNALKLESNCVPDSVREMARQLLLCLL
jgi:hypothetical protein